MSESNLDLGLIGNGSFGALLDARARVVWCCLPAFDGDPGVLRAAATADRRRRLDGRTRGLRPAPSSTTSTTPRCCRRSCTTPRRRGRDHRLRAALAPVRPLLPAGDAGAADPAVVRQPAHPPAAASARRLGRARCPSAPGAATTMRFLLRDMTLRLTTDAPLRLLRDELPFVLDRELHFVLGPDETLTQPIDAFVRDAEQQTISYWREWVRYLSIPLEWQDAVIRSAITLKLCQYEDTGAIVAALTTSIPEAPHTPRNWDYRYCWLRDAAFVVRALNRLGATAHAWRNTSATSSTSSPATIATLQPVYGIGFETRRWPRTKCRAWPATAAWARCGAATWRGCRSSTTSTAASCSPRRSCSSTSGWSIRGDIAMFAAAGAARRTRVRACTTSPMPGLWEFRGRAARAHLFGGDVLGRLRPAGARSPRASGSPTASRTGASAPTRSASACCARRGTPSAGISPTRSAASDLDASLLLLADLGFVDADDPRFIATVEAIGRDLRRGDAPVPLHRRRRFRRAGNQLHHLHVLVHRRAGRDRPHGRGARACSSGCWRGAIRWACCRRTSHSTAARPGATSRRPIRMVGLINAAMRAEPAVAGAT